MEKLSVSQEDYLKQIYLIHLQGKAIRVTDVALQLGISKPSVNKAINALKQLGYITHEHYGTIGLTPEGILLGEDLVENERICYRFLTETLGVEEETAQTEASAMGHVISKTTRKKLKKFIKKEKDEKAEKAKAEKVKPKVRIESAGEAKTKSEKIEKTKEKTRTDKRQKKK